MTSSIPVGCSAPGCVRARRPPLGGLGLGFDVAGGDGDVGGGGAVWRIGGGGGDARVLWEWGGKMR